MTSSLLDMAQPPCWKPPRVSSSGRPGACITPSSVKCSVTEISLIWCSFPQLGWTCCRRHDRDRPVVKCLERDVRRLDGHTKNIQLRWRESRGPISRRVSATLDDTSSLRWMRLTYWLTVW